MSEVPFPQLRRVIDPNGSHIEPPLDQSWSDLDKLRWQAAVVRVDNDGTVATVYEQPTPGQYGISAGRASIASFDFYGAWTYLNGFSHGLQTARGTR